MLQQKVRVRVPLPCAQVVELRGAVVNVVFVFQNVGPCARAGAKGRHPARWWREQLAGCGGTILVPLLELGKYPRPQQLEHCHELHNHGVSVSKVQDTEIG